MLSVLRNVPPRYMYERVAKVEKTLIELREYARTGAESMRKLKVTAKESNDIETAEFVPRYKLDIERYESKEAVYALMYVELDRVLRILTEPTEEDAKYFRKEDK